MTKPTEKKDWFTVVPLFNVQLEDRSFAFGGGLVLQPNPDWLTTLLASHGLTEFDRLELFLSSCCFVSQYDVSAVGFSWLLGTEVPVVTAQHDLFVLANL